MLYSLESVALPDFIRLICIDVQIPKVVSVLILDIFSAKRQLDLICGVRERQMWFSYKKHELFRSW